VKGEAIGLPPEIAEQSGRPNGDQARDHGFSTEFIHLGYAHPDYSKWFEGKATDDVAFDAPAEPALHGAKQRAALQREALLLAGFVTGVQTTLKERQAAKGKTGVGALVGAAADVLGGKGGKASEPTPEDCNRFTKAIKDAADKVKGPEVAYKDVHQAGIDLRQARLDYAAYVKGLVDKPPPDSSGGLLSGVSGLAGKLPGGLGDAVTIVQGIAFKPLDVYLGIVAGIASKLEPKVMEACHTHSIDAIRTSASPIFAPWYRRPADAAAGGPSLATHTGVDPVDSTTGSVDKGYQGARDFLADTKGRPHPCERFLDQAFVIQPPPGADKGEAAKPAKAVADVIVASFEKAIGVDSLPGFLETLISEICAIDAEFLLAIYKTLLKRDPSKPIDEDELRVAARKRLLDKLVNLLVSKVSFLQSAREMAFAPKFNQGEVVNVSPGNFEDRGKNLLNEQFGKYLNPALDFAMSDVWKRLEGARSQAQDEKSMTMEVYLGLQPWMLALLFRDTFFPVWDLLVEKGMPFVNDKLGGVFRSMDAFREDAKSGLDDVRDDLAKADAMKEAAAHNKGVGTDPNKNRETMKQFSDAADAKAERKQVAKAPDAIAEFPTPARGNTGSGKTVAETEFKDVEQSHKWAQAEQAPQA
jgi:hypothetical protein